MLCDVKHFFKIFLGTGYSFLGKKCSFLLNKYSNLE